MIETLLRSPTFVTFLVASFILAITPGRLTFMLIVV